MIYARWRIMGTGPPVFTEADNPASFADSMFLRVSQQHVCSALMTVCQLEMLIKCVLESNSSGLNILCMYYIHLMQWHIE